PCSMAQSTVRRLKPPSLWTTALTGEIYAAYSQRAFPTSPHPRRRLGTIVQRGVTLTFHLVQKIGQATLLSRLGRLDEAIKSTDQVLHVAESSGMEVSEARLGQDQARVR